MTELEPSLTTEAHARRIERWRFAAPVFAVVAMLIGVAALAGWVTDTLPLKGVASGIAMKTNTAIALVLSGLGLFLLSSRTVSPRRAAIGQALGAVVALIGLATLSEHLFGWNLGIDQLLFREAPGAAATTSPNRMGTTASTCFALLGSALVLLGRRDRSIVVPQRLAMVSLVIAFIPLTGYIRQEHDLFGIARLTGIALNTVIALLVLSLGLLAARPETGILRRVLADDAAGVLLRRMLPAAILLPFVLGWLRVLGERAGLYDVEFGRSLATVFFVVTFTGLIWWTAAIQSRHTRALEVAQATLRQSEQRFGAVYEHAPFAIALARLATGAIVDVNAAWERLTGVAREEAIGRTSVELGLAVDPAGRDGLLESTRREGVSPPLEIAIRTRAGETRIVSNRVTVVTVGEERFFLATLEDVTERRRSEQALRESEEWLRLALDSGRLGTFIYDFRSATVAATARYKELFGFAADLQPTRDEYQAVVHPDDRERNNHEWERGVAERRRIEIEYRVLAADGSWRWVASYGQAIYDQDGQAERYIGVSMDLTERKRAEAMLREADRQKDEFIAVLAHELRNPLAPIRNAVAILQQQGPPDPELVWARNVIDRQASHMARLLDDLLDVSRITRRRLDLRRQRLTLKHVIDRGLETSRPLVDAGGHRLAIELPPDDVWLDGDPLRLSQVVSNLVNNAAKYTSSRGEISVRAAREGDQVVIAVRDNGIGITPEDLPRVFDVFAQAAPALERSHGGLGIGLSLVRGIVEAHGGTVEAHSDGMGQGSEFIVRLPAAAAPVHAPADATPAHVPSAPGSPLRIVVADDNADALDSLTLVLRRGGHDVHPAADGAEAVEVAGRVRPDVALLDIGMPRLNGYEAARRIRGEDWGRTIVLVALTGWGQQEDRQRAVEAGFDEHLVKPVEPARLATLLRHISTPVGEPRA
ncbi:MAG TPA: PAS domain S-box protein [Candidatus Eisenbacteria bacterium]|nr:PAS domain S-box protein [Candidatus Eisenbacteria bacterium]